MYQKCFFENPHGQSFHYILSLPEGYDSGKRYPLVIFLHGAGERGREDGSEIGLLGRYEFVKKYPSDWNKKAIVAAPQCPSEKYWGCYTESLNRFLDMLLEKLPVDEKRVSLTGLSMGGTGTWMWALANPERFAAIAPVCGSGIYWYGEKLVDKAVWAFHGDIDDIVPPEESLKMVQSVNKRGGHAKLTVFHGVGHDAWDPAYGDLTLFDWLTEQSL